MTATNFKASPTIIVIGAGPVGLYTAYVLAGTGCNVSVISDGRRGAGWASGGMLGAAYEILGDPDLPQNFKTFARESQILWAQFIDTLDLPVVPGSVFIARDDGECDRFAKLALDASAFGVSLAACEVPSGMVARQAWTCPSDVVFDPRLMLSTLRQHCIVRGVSFKSGTVTGVARGEVTLDGINRAFADHIIVATGQGGDALASQVPELATISLVKGQMMAVDASGVALDAAMRAGRIYLLPRGERIVIGATSQPEDSDIDRFNAHEHSRLLEEAIMLCPSLALGRVVESWAGLRPMTPDALPLVGHSQVDGVIVATGSYRNGWLLAAGIANTVMGLVLGGDTACANLQLFAPNRFPTPVKRSKCPDNSQAAL